MFHYCNWVLWGNKQDFLAWKGLVGEIGKEEIINTLARESGGLEKMWERSKFLWENDPEWAAARRAHLVSIRNNGVLAAMSEETRLKQKETFKTIKHSQGERNSQYGTMWITNGTENKKLKKESPMPEGYKRGRTL